MIKNVIELFIALIGIAFNIILFKRFPKLPLCNIFLVNSPTVSVIIPARNEEKNIKSLIYSLKKQFVNVNEIICADDDSSDLTATIAKEFGIKIVTFKNKPKDWLGKSWVCKNAADLSNSELLLFIDADVKLSSKALLRILSAYKKYNCTITVKPYHITTKFYEQFSLFFNLIEIAANKTTSNSNDSLGLFGPVILIKKSDYYKIGGHTTVKSSIAEDLDLGIKLRKRNINFKAFIGDKDISYRMYNSGYIGMVHGWTKNFATGAFKTPFYIFCIVFFWVSSLISVPTHIIKFILVLDFRLAIIYGFLYVLWVIILKIISAKIGRFNLYTCLLYPVFLFGFLIIFTISLIKKIFKIKVIWKGRGVKV